MTCSAVDNANVEQIRRRVYLALFIALAVALHTIEVLLPNPLPWFRIGLANILAVTALFYFDVRALWTVNLLRIFVGHLLLGSLFAPGFLMAAGGGLVATALMGLCYGFWRGRIGPVGISVIGAQGHVIGQVLIAWLVVVRHASVWNLLPFLLAFALISGIVNGLIADHLIAFLNRRACESEAATETEKTITTNKEGA